MSSRHDTDSISRKHKVIEDAVRAIKKQFGTGAIMRLGSDEAAEVEVIPTGSLSLDIALGVGGLPRGRIIEIYGPESSGKTTLALHAIAQVQQRGGICAFIDAEHALDTLYARRLGLKVDELLVSQPDCGEQALEIADTLVHTAAVDLLVVDSVAALTPRAELEGDMGDAHMGLQARLMSQALRKLTAAIARTQTTIIFINQLRHKIGLVFGSPETTTGGNALKFYASVRLDIRRGKAIKKNDLPVGAEVRVKVVKNKLAPPFREAHFDIMYGTGINRQAELIDSGERLGLIIKTGSWYSYQEHRLGQGRERAAGYLDHHPDLAATLRQAIWERGRLALPGSQPTPAGAPAPAAAGAANSASGAADPATGAANPAGAAATDNTNPADITDTMPATPSAGRRARRSEAAA